jgi:predicted acetyltransferase
MRRIFFIQIKENSITYHFGLVKLIFSFHSDSSSTKMLAIIALALQGTLQAQLCLYTNKGTFFLAEFFKFCISSLLSFKDPKRLSWNSIVLLGLYCIIFAIQNHLLLKGISLIANPFLFQLTCQSKLIATALVSPGRSTSIWSLLGILIGIAIVLNDSSTIKDSRNGISFDFKVGAFFVIAASFGNAIGGRIYEKAIYSEKLGMWKTSQIVSAFSTLFLLPSIRDVFKVIESPFSLLTLCSQIVGGYLVAFVVQKHGNLAKVTASSLGITIQALISKNRTNFPTLLGTLLVLYCSFAINKSQSASNSPKPNDQSASRKPQKVSA